MPAEAVLVTDKSANGWFTVVLTVAELLAGTRSVSLAETVAVLASAPARVGVTTIVTVALAPTARLPRLAVTLPPLVLTLPCDTAAET